MQTTFAIIFSRSSTKFLVPISNCFQSKKDPTREDTGNESKKVDRFQIKVDEFDVADFDASAPVAAQTGPGAEFEKKIGIFLKIC